MLGLSSTVSSGSILESLYSITLDGTDDYIDLGTGISLGTADFTISLWVKTADFHNKYFISEFVDAENRWFLHTNSVDPPQLHFVQEIGDTAHTTYVDTSESTNLDNLQNAWTHLAISADRDGNVIGYVNGVAGSTVSGQATSLTTTANTFIGRYSSTYSAIQIDEVAIWNAALNEDNITAIYNSGRPTNLTLNNGNYNQSSALQAYYRMGNGTFDDKANGVIHDQHNPGYGAELVTNGTFTGITQSESTTGSEWTTGVGWTISGDIARSDGTQTDVSHLKQLGIVPINKYYKVVFDIVVDAGSMVVAVGGSNAQPTITSTNTYTYYTRATSGDSHFYFSAAADFVGSIDNVTVKELNGFPGLTSDADGSGFNFTSDTP